MLQLDCPHIVLHESGLPFEAVLASTKTKKLQDGTDFYTINAKGSVPVLELDNGERLTEGPAIVQYLADLAPMSHLLAPAGTVLRARTQAWVGYLNAEIHAGCFRAINRPQRYCPDPSGQATVRQQGLLRLQEALVPIEEVLRGRDSLVAGHFTMAFEGTGGRESLTIGDTTYQIQVEGREAAREAVVVGIGVGVVSAAEFGADARVCALPIVDCQRRLTETLVCLREQSSRRIVATFLEMVRESLV